MIIFKWICIFTIFIFLSSCQKELNVDIDCEPKMVVAGILVPGRQVEVKLTSSIPVRAKKKVTPIEGATVSLYEGSSLLGTLTYSTDSTYTLDIPVMQGKTYTLRATCQGYPPIEASTTIPTLQPIEALLDVDTLIRSENNQVDFSLCFSINIPSMKLPSYYGMFFFSEKIIDDGFESFKYFQIIPTHKPDKYVEFVDRSFSYSSSKYRIKDFTDVKLNLELNTYSPNDMEATGSRCVFFTNEPFLGNGHTIIQVFDGVSNIFSNVNIFILSEELYKSFKGFAAHSATSNSLFISPVSAYNSINGGLGYFGSALIHTINLTNEKARINKNE